VSKSLPSSHPEFEFVASMEDAGVEISDSVRDRRFVEQIESFEEFGKTTHQEVSRYERSGGAVCEVPCYLNEFWTARQRQAHSLHEVSYRACFKPQLPAFFIDRLTEPGAVVYDPFMGRGTTLLEAALSGRVPFGCDVNPLSRYLLRPRLSPPLLSDVEARLDALSWDCSTTLPEELKVFYHPETLRSICALRDYLMRRDSEGSMDGVDEWIRLVAVNRLTGHSAGFFSVYSMPPNQAVSVKSQQRINARRNQTPPLRDVPRIILKKSKALLKDLSDTDRSMLTQAATEAQLLVGQASQTPQIGDQSMDMVVTSPPFLDVVDYATDNWLRCWFVGLDPDAIDITVARKLADWEAAMMQVFRELARILKPGGYIAFEVGEVRKGTVQLESTILKCGAEAGLSPWMVLINAQSFTKTANCWGVDNNSKGTNSNRIVLFRKA